MIQLIIEFDEINGTVHVKGPIDNKILSYGLLGVAKDIIQTSELKVQPIENKIIKLKPMASN